MVRVRGDITIARPVEEVFDFVADESNEPKYNPRMARAEKVTSGAIGAGTQFKSRVGGLGGPADMTIEFTEFDRPRRIAEKVHLSTLDIQGLLLFEPAAGGTRMEWIWDLYPHGFMRLLGPLVRGVGDQQERAIWNSLKRFMEGAAVGAGTTKAHTRDREITRS